MSEIRAILVLVRQKVAETLLWQDPYKHSFDLFKNRPGKMPRIRKSTKIHNSRTRIICTVGPASDSPETLRRLVLAGMDVARLNFSHGTHAEHGAVIDSIRKISLETGKPVAILQDLSGPKIRIGKIQGDTVRLEPGRQFTLTTRNVSGNIKLVSVSYKKLPSELEKGDRLLLSDGAIELRVIRTDSTDVVCRVVVGGTLSSNKGINLPSTSISTPGLTTKDEKDLLFGIERGVDFAAMSFVRKPEDLAAARRLMLRNGGKLIPLIAKIEKHEALALLEEIVETADGVMVARGDLGVEIPMENVPGIQKEIIRLANTYAKPVITATQMLRSMVDSPTPTRAEVTDVANAVLDGTDAVMLSEETAVGQYPERAVRTMEKIIRATELTYPFNRNYVLQENETDPEEAVALCACTLAENTGASLIITCTESGSTSRLVAKYRPEAPVLALTPNESTFRYLAMVWGVHPELLEPAATEKEMLRAARDKALELGFLKPGQKAVLTAGLPLEVPRTTNLVRLISAQTK